MFALCGVAYSPDALSARRWGMASGASCLLCVVLPTALMLSLPGGGAWLVEHRVEQRKRFKALLCSKPRTFDDIRKERNKADREGTIFAPHPRVVFDEEDGKEDDYRCLDGFFLVSCVINAV